MKLEVFDPAMCCATGICGNSVDPKLVTFAADLEWLKKQGIDVVRYGLSFEPAKFVENEAVKTTLQSDGNGCLPIIIIENKIMSKACYPSRQKLAEICNLTYPQETETCCDAGCDCTNAAAEDNCCCPPDCDCHKSAISDRTKKLILFLIILMIIGIIAVKMSAKAHAAEPNSAKLKPSINKTLKENFGENITSLNKIKPTQEVAFVYIPTKNNKNTDAKTKSAAISAQKILSAKKIKTDLYTLSPDSKDYESTISQTKAPAILVIYKGKGKSTVSGDINTTKLLQAYMQASLAGGCGAGCPCHKK